MNWALAVLTFFGLTPAWPLTTSVRRPSSQFRCLGLERTSRRAACLAV